MSEIQCEKKVALVTGGSRGIGAAVARRLAIDGFRVIINYHTCDDAADDVVKTIVSSGGDAFTYKADVSSPEEANAMLGDILRRWERLDVIVNNAGISRDALLSDMDTSDWRRVMDVNFGSVFNMTTAAIPHFMSRAFGIIVNVSSVMANRGWIGQSNYSASKGAIEAFTRSSAVELARFGIRVNAVAPGFVPTDLVSTLMEKSARDIRRQIPLRRFGDPAEVANIVSFLCSDDAQYISGACFVIDGGASAQLGLGKAR